MKIHTHDFGQMPARRTCDGQLGRASSSRVVRAVLELEPDEAWLLTETTPLWENGRYMFEKHTQENTRTRVLPEDRSVHI